LPDILTCCFRSVFRTCRPIRIEAHFSDGLPTEKTTAALDVGIERMTCASCVRRGETMLSRVPGVADVSVNLGTERACLALNGAPAGILRMTA
jgi:copper chaperone CopZ